MKHKIGVVMVSLNCLEMSRKSISSVVSDSHELYKIWISNGSTDGTREYLQSGEALAEETADVYMVDPIVTGLAACWNRGIEKAIEAGCDQILVINNDIAFSRTTLDNLSKRIESGDVLMVTGVDVSRVESPEEVINSHREYSEENINEHPDFSCFIITPETIKRVGWFDENYIVAYFEDNDYHGRFAMIGEKAITIACAPYYHYGSQTSKKNPQMADVLTSAFVKNREFFKEKFGSEPVGDVEDMRNTYFKTPFNSPDKDWKDTRRDLEFIGNF